MEGVPTVNEQQMISYQDESATNEDTDKLGGSQEFLEEFDQIRMDLKRKRRRDSTEEEPTVLEYFTDEKKLNLALQTSQATHPGAFRDGNSMSYDEEDDEIVNKILTQQQTEDYVTLKVATKRRAEDTTPTDHNHTNDVSGCAEISPLEAQVLDDFQKHMTAIQAKTVSEVNDDDDARAQCTRNALCLILTAFFAVTISVIIGTIVGVVASSSNDTSDKVDAELLQPSSAPSWNADKLIDCYVGSSQQTESYSNYLSILVSKFPHIENLQSVERLSLCWLADFDELPITLADLDEVQVLQRYVLVLLYNILSETTLEQTNWLSAVHICEWDFITCHEDMTIQSLFLHLDCQCSDCICSRIPFPEKVTNLHSLEVLDLESNIFTGQLPSELGNLSGLKVLNLRDNRLSGTIPNSITNLFNLRYLNLEQNGFSGTLPDLSQLTHLISLHLERNVNIVGPCPEISLLSNLETLIIRDIDLTGALSTIITATLSNLRILSLNALTGEIPSEIGTLSKLALNVQGKITGTIPTEIGKLGILNTLNVGSSKLTGTLPSEIGQLSSLMLFFLDDNHLTGRVPEEVCSLLQIGTLQRIVPSSGLNCSCCL